MEVYKLNANGKKECGDWVNKNYFCERLSRLSVGHFNYNIGNPISMVGEAQSPIQKSSRQKICSIS